MSKNLLFTFRQEIGNRAYRPGVKYGRINVYWDDATGAVVEEATQETNFVTRTSAAQMVYEYRIVQDQVSTYAPCAGTTLVQFFADTDFPFVYKTETPDSPFCSLPGVDPNQIFLDVDTYDETLPGAEDGRIEIQAVSTRPIVQYSITNTETNDSFVNTTGIFSNLAPGVYFISVSAGTDPVTGREIFAFTTATINTGQFDEYGVYAQVHTGTRRHNKPVLLQIKKKGYVGTTFEAKMPDDDSFQLSYKGTNTDWLFSFANGLTLDFSLWGEYLRDWSILYTQDDREYLIELTVDDILVFRGYLLPEFYDAAYYQFAHPVALVATDGIGQLKDYSFLKANGEKLSGSYTLEAICEICLSKVNLGIPIYHRIEWAYGAYTAGADLFSHITIRAEYFYVLFQNPTCADVLGVIMEAFAARVSQVEGVFLIEQPWSPLTTETFTAYSKTISKVFTRISDSSCSDFTDDNVLLTTGSRSGVYPGVKTQTIDETLYPTIGLVKNSNLQNYDLWRNTGVGREIEVKYWNTTGVVVLPFIAASLPRVVTAAGAPRTQFGGEGDEPATGIVCDGMVFNAIHYRKSDAKNVSTQLGYIYREGNAVEINPADLTFLVYLKVFCKTVESAVAFKIGLSWQADNGNTYWLAEDNSAWVLGGATPSSRIYQIAQSSQEQELEVKFETPSLPLGSTLPPITLPQAGNFTLYISEPFAFKLDSNGNVIDGDPLALYPVANSYPTGFTARGAGSGFNNKLTNVLCLRQAQVKPLIAHNELVSNKPRAYQNAGEYTTQEVNSKLRIGTHYYGKNNELFYPYALRDSVTDKAITYWFGADGTSFEMGELLLREMVKARKIIRPFASVTLKGYFVFYQRLRVLVDSNIEYFAQSLTWNIINDEFTGDFVYAGGDYALPFYRLNEDGTVKLQEDGTTLRIFESRTFDESFVEEIEDL